MGAGAGQPGRYGVALVAGHDIQGSPDELREEWDSLADRTDAPPFLRPGWIEAWHRAFGRGELTVLAVRRDDRVAGVLPVQSARGALASPTDWHTPVFGPVVEDTEAAGEIARALLARARRRADLWFLSAGSPGLDECAAAADEAGFRRIVRTIALAPYVPVEGPFEEYMGGLDRKFRKEIGRLWRRLEDRGAVEVGYEDGSEGLDGLLTEGFRLEGSGWKEEAGTAILSDPRVERFYRDVARWAAERGWLRLAFLRLDGRPIAFDMCLEQGGAFYVLKGGFDVEERRLGPGTLLTHHGIERAFERGLSSYELLGQADDYKRSWTSLTRERVRVQAFPRSPAGTAEYLAWSYGRPLVKRLSSGSSSSPSP
jgi:CelD/BcsL family acetyltransferase involved in cellulose biosynthesis